MERDLSSLIHPHNVTWPGYYVHLILLWNFLCPHSNRQLWLWSSCTPFLFITSQAMEPLWMCWQCNQTWNTGYSPSPTLPTNHSLSIYWSHHSMSGTSPPKRARRIAQGLFHAGSWRSYQSISSPYYFQKGWMIQSLSGLSMPMTISYLGSSFRLSPSSIPNPFLPTNSFSKVSTPLTKITVLLPHGPLTTTWCCSLQRFWWGWTNIREVYAQLSMGSLHWDLLTDSLWRKDNHTSLFWMDFSSGVTED